MKKLFVILILSVFGANAWALGYTHVTIGNIQYFLREDNTAGVQSGENATGAVTIPGTITYDGKTYTVDEIVMEAFASNYNITSLTIAPSIVEIGDNAFEGCTALTKAELTGVTMLGKGVFEGCYSLNEVTLGENLTEIPNFTFQSCSSLSGLIVPAKVKRIGECAFMNSGMEAINIPSAVETIDTRAFQWCSSLEDVTFNEGLKTIGEYAFSDSYVERVALPSTLETIGKNAFSNCTSIRTIVFPPKSIANMASGLFNGLWRLSRVECEATVPPVIPANTFDGSNGTLYVPTASIEAYKAADGWKYFGNVEGTTPVTGNGDANCDGVIDVLDLNIVINYMLGMGGFSSEDAMNNANVNGDSSIDIVDVNGIINIILGIK